MWGNPQGDPAAVGGIYLADTIENIGLVNRDAITSDGRDLLFMDDTGLRSLGRTIQEQSAAIGDLTRPVRTDITSDLRKTLLVGGVELVFSPKNSFVLIIMRGIGVVWVADTRMRLQDGSFRMTVWPQTQISTAFYLEEFEKVIFGIDADDVALADYNGSSDYTGTPYVFEYSSPILSFGDSTRLKIVKQVDYTIIAGTGNAEAEARIDYFGFRDRVLSRTFSVIGAGVGSQYANNEYNSGAEYGEGEKVFRSYRYNAGSSGENVRGSFKPGSIQIKNAGH